MWNDTNISEKIKAEDNYYKQPNWNLPGVNVTDIEQFWLKRESFTKNGFKFEHNEILNGMEGMLIIFWTNLSKNETLYDNWNFPTPAAFDEFWFDDVNTQILYHTSNYIIGS